MSKLLRDLREGANVAVVVPEFNMGWTLTVVRVGSVTCAEGAVTTVPEDWCGCGMSTPVPVHDGTYDNAFLGSDGVVYLPEQEHTTVFYELEGDDDELLLGLETTAHVLTEAVDDSHGDQEGGSGAAVVDAECAADRADGCGEDGLDRAAGEEREVPRGDH